MPKQELSIEQSEAIRVFVLSLAERLRAHETQ
jgi:hypothetical protein